MRLWLGGMLGAIALVCAAGNIACAGCPRAGRSISSDEPLDQRGAPPPSAENVLLIDEPLVVSTADTSLEPMPLTRADVRSVIDGQTVDLQRCYERARAEHPAMHGRLVLELEIAASGHVLRVNVVQDGIGDGVLAGCFADHARHWHFPESAHQTTLRYPFELTLSEAG
jgi:hypothetical protein